MRILFYRTRRYYDYHDWQLIKWKEIDNPLMFINQDVFKLVSFCHSLHFLRVSWNSGSQMPYEEDDTIDIERLEKEEEDKDWEKFREEDEN